MSSSAHGKPSRPVVDRTASDPPKKGHPRLADAFRFAFFGIAQAWGSERNMKIQAAFAVLACILGALLGISALEWVAIVVCIAVVLSLEVVNTAIEAIVDLASPDIHVLAKRAKDCAAGAVLIAALGSVVVACIIFIPALARVLGIS